MSRRAERAWPAAATLFWVLLPFTAGELLAVALDDRPAALRATASTLAWVWWAVVLVLSLVPRTVSLTLVRLGAPAAVAVTTWAAFERGEADALAAIGVSLAAAATVVVLSAPVGDWFVNGSSYGAERRFALRAPVALVFGPLPLLWLAVNAGLLTGPLLLGADQWLAGAVALAVGVPVAALGARRAHLLARRWLVMVPAGVVVHDPMALADSLLVRTRDLDRLRLAPADTDATDLTLGATGLAVQLDLRAPATILTQAARRAAGGSLSATEEVDAVLVTPSRPGAVLRTAAERRLPVG